VPCLACRLGRRDSQIRRCKPPDAEYSRGLQLEPYHTIHRVQPIEWQCPPSWRFGTSVDLRWFKSCNPAHHHQQHPLLRKLVQRNSLHCRRTGHDSHLLQWRVDECPQRLQLWIQRNRLETKLIPTTSPSTRLSEISRRH